MKKQTVLLWLGLILLVTFISFYPSLKNGFTNWDDDKMLTNNFKITALTPENLKAILTKPHWGLYHPIVLLSFAVEFHFFKLDPFPYHLTNLILHLINTALVFWLIFILSKKTWTAGITALLFGIHPLHVASVAWITERKDVLYALFFVSASISYLYYLKTSPSPSPLPQGERKRPANSAAAFYALSIVLFILSLLAKPMAITLPFVLLLVDFLEKRTFDKKLLMEKAPFFVITVIFTVITYIARSIGSEPEYTFIDNLFIANYGLLFYLVKAAAPLKLACHYPPPVKIGGFLPAIFLLSPVAVLAFAAGTLYSLKFTRKFFFGVLFYVITVGPVLHIVSGGPTVGDHYTYIPLVGIFYLVGEGYSWLWDKKTDCRNILLVTLAAVTAVCAVLTWQRCLVWKDALTLWNDFFAKYGDRPNISLAYSNRGNAYMDAGDLDKAVLDYNEAVRLDPSYVDALNNRGNVYNTRGEYDKAIADYNKVLSMRPRHAEAHYNRGNAYIFKGNYQQAIADYTEAVRINPEYAEAYNNLGNSLCDTGNSEGALPLYAAAIKIKPLFPEAYANRGNALCNLGRFEEAVADYTQAVQTNPRYAQAYLARANAHRILGRFQEAWNDVRTIRQLGYQVDPAFLEKLRTESGTTP
jgi:tetratricopeptide (TPR) repeat protein